MKRLLGSVLVGSSLAVILLLLHRSDANTKPEVKHRFRRAAYQLPDGVEFLIDPIRTTFECPGDGYYADMDNECKLFHVCHSYQLPDGRVEMQHHTFACGNQTVFNQLSFTCAFEEDAIPCRSAGDFFYLNQVLGLANEPFLTDTDLQRADEFFGRRNFARSQPDDEDAAAAPPARQPASAPPPRAAARRAAALRAGPETTTTKTFKIAAETTTTTQAPTTTSPPQPTTTNRPQLNARIVIAGSDSNNGQRRKTKRAKTNANSNGRVASASVVSPSNLLPGTQIFITRLRRAK